MLFFLLKQKMGAALFRLHRFQTFCRRASDTPDLKQNRYACSVFRADSSMPRPASVSLRWRAFYGRGWIARAALLKTAHRAVFAPSSATGPQLFESTRMKTQTFCKQKTASVSLRWRSFYGRGWITQAALLKTAHRAVFAPSSATGPQLFESTRLASGKVITKQKLQYPVRILEFLVERSNPNPNHCPLGHLWRRFHRK